MSSLFQCVRSGRPATEQHRSTFCRGCAQRSALRASNPGRHELHPQLAACGQTTSRLDFVVDAVSRRAWNSDGTVSPIRAEGPP